MHGSTLWVNLVDGDVDMQIVSVMMNSADSLVFRIAKPSTNTCLYLLQHISAKRFSLPEAENQMKRLVPFRTFVHVLGSQDFFDSGTQSSRFAVCDPNLAHSMLFALGRRDIGDQISKTT